METNDTTTEAGDEHQVERERFERFMANVIVGDGCWMWTGRVANDKMGYGSIWMDGRHTAAHRAAWTIFIGTIPIGLCVLHHCDTPLCVRPSHLFLGTKGDNNRDRAAKGRTVVPLGEAHGRSTLSAGAVAEIKALRCTVSQRELARRFNTTQSNISSIQRGRTRSTT